MRDSLAWSPAREQAGLVTAGLPDSPAADVLNMAVGGGQPQSPPRDSLQQVKEEGKIPEGRKGVRAGLRQGTP